MRRAHAINIALSLFGVFGGGVVAAVIGLATDAVHHSFWVGFLVAMIIGAIAAAVAVLVGAFGDRETTERLEESRKMLPLLGMIIFGAGFAICTAWYFWPLKANKPAVAAAAPSTAKGPPPPTAQPAEPPVEARPPASPALPPDSSSPVARAPTPTPIRVLLECMPASSLDVVPQSGVSYHLWIGAPGTFSNGVIPLSFMRENSGSKIYGDDPLVGISSHKCMITNYSETLIVNAEISVNIIYREAIKNGNTVSTGGVQSTESHVFSIAKIDPGSGNGFQFQINNQSGQFVTDVSFAREIHAMRADVEKQESFPFIVTGQQPIRLFP